MRIEVLETFLHQGQRFEKGEVRAIEDNAGVAFCTAGMARDTDGVAATGELNPHQRVTIQPDNVVIGEE